ncbi:MAG: HlyD family secretion protein [Bacteroidia bacterium]|nr:HlyD family secretion protein [Bacteroidia bacterium]MBT8267885.1 HlyD family secretion protein [Bacteroidia bacterium]NNF83145.1 HlyD family efflux transporter periplasmic adaptor subunit [Flavobacteriaceae bacterium]NNK71148.1 HlyD family efflux transporter periplasmic adaptor subunit [Flavobacteriaceae bacterium]NNL79407.1 HlyD family efflux transporter periplasmic adaptor subunit [Flavobacteriaceae bacterium]
MLNISHNKLNTSVNLEQFQSSKKVFVDRYSKYFNRFLAAFAIILLIVLFLPWTQNITGGGQVTTLKPDQRPQAIQSPIPGRIEQWFVREGDYVKRGDTILKISEVKSDYFDPALVSRTGEQIQAKSQAVTSYEGKVNALDRQISALVNERSIKLKQTENKLIQSRLKVKSDSIDLQAARTNENIAERQYNRTVALQEEGLKAVRDVEDKRLKLQETQAKLISQENKLMASRNQLLNAEMEILRLGAAYADKISKAQSDKYTAQSSQYDTQAQVSKLENQYSNYEIRNTLQFVTAPQDGFINKALIGGIGMTFKEGDRLVTIMPEDYDLAVETYVEPIDLPLIHLGEKVRVQFDGWPAIVFSGWPNVSYGTYGAEVVAIENFISDNGKYRILLAPDKSDHTWPEAIRVGSGARTIALLDDVPIWFEMWRKLNGFPPNYYKPAMANNAKK